MELDLDLLVHTASLLQAPPKPLGKPKAPRIFALERGAEEQHRARLATQLGERLLSEGKLAFVLVAGGQASRLGYDAPKGAFPIGPVSQRSLFSMHAARLQAARKRYGKPMPWYIMTSPGNDQATREFFAEHAYFGLPPEDITFFSQKMQPALDPEGRLLFSSPTSLFLAPNGHGGCLLALRTSGALQEMSERGIEYASYFQVDNPMVRPADALFIGLHAKAGAGMSSKIVPKCEASEKVGVIGLVDGKLHCIEYSDMTPAELEARDADGRLTFRAGNIAVHMFSREFLDSVAGGGEALPWHIASKRMRVCLADGSYAEVPGYKFETFVFDALQSSPESITLEVSRDLEFAPVKNMQGVDSPASARAALMAMHASWARAAGATLPQVAVDGQAPVEIDPLVGESETEVLAQGLGEPTLLNGGHYYGPGC